MLNAIVRSGDVHDAIQETALLDADAAWASSALLATLLATSGPGRPVLDRARAAQLIGEETLDDLLKRHLVRNPLGRIVIPGGVVTALSRSTSTRFTATDASSLRALYDEMGAVERAMPTISASDLNRLHTSHATVFQSTPSIALLQKHCAIEPDGGNFRIDLRAGTWSAVLPRAAARLWEQRGVSAKPTDDLLSWLDLLSGSDRWVSAPGEMTSNARERWLDAALDLVLAEPDLQGWAEESERLKLESDYDGWALQQPLPASDATPARRYRWWDEVHHATSEVGDRDASRGTLLALVAAIMRGDSLTGAYSARARRIRAVLLGGEMRPALSYHGPRLLLRVRPAALAWLLSDEKLAALAMTLVLKIQTRDSELWGTHEEHSDRALERRRPVVRDAFAVLFESLGTRFGGDEGLRATTETLLDVFIPLSRNACARGRLAHPSALAEKRAAEATLRIGLDELGRSTIETRVSRAGAAYHPPLMNVLADSLLEGLARRATDAAHPDFAPIPFGVLPLLFWLLHEIPPRASLVLGSPPPSASTIALVIRDVYGAALKLDDWKTGPVHWRDDAPEFADHSWEEVALALLDTGRLEALVTPPELNAIIQRVSSPPVEEIDTHEWHHRRTGENKIRSHLRVLFRIHEQLPSLERRARADGGSLAKLRDAVEDAIADVLGTATAPVLFDRDKNHLGADVVELHAQAVRSVNRFSSGRRQETFRRWFRRLTDPLLLLSAADEIASAHALIIAHDRLRELFDKAEPLEREHWLPDISRLAMAAATAAEPEIANRVLEFGDKVTREHAMRPEWEATAFRVRLVLAYHAKDPKAVQELNAPTGPGIDTQAVEFSRRFYKALLLLDTQPDVAERLLCELEGEKPGNVGILINLFAARLRKAARLEATAQPAAYALALEDWTKIEPFLPPGERKKIGRAVAYNELVSLAGARLDERFDTTWGNLPIETKCRHEFVSLAVSHYRSRNRSGDVGDIIALARQYHAAPDGSVPKDLEALEAIEDTGRPITMSSLEILPHPGVVFGNLAALSSFSAQDAARSIYGPKVTLADFLAAELCEAAKVLLVRSTTLRDLQVEDKYTDMLGSFMEQRLVHFPGWGVKDQPRGGASAGGAKSATGGVGERDLVVVWRGGEVAVVEALRLEYLNRGEITKHVGKVPRYDLIGLEQGYVVVFYRGDVFEELCAGYLDHIRAIQLPGLETVSAEQRDPGVRSGLGSNLRVFRAMYRRAGIAVTVDHLVLYLTHDLPAVAGAVPSNTGGGR